MKVSFLAYYSLTYPTHYCVIRQAQGHNLCLLSFKTQTLHKFANGIFSSSLNPLLSVTTPSVMNLTNGTSMTASI